MKVPSFNEFLTEQTDSKLKILVLSDEPENAEMYHTAKRIKAVSYTHLTLPTILLV